MQEPSFRQYRAAPDVCPAVRVVCPVDLDEYRAVRVGYREDRVGYREDRDVYRAGPGAYPVGPDVRIQT